jgi:hypothetical protein
MSLEMYLFLFIEVMIIFAFFGFLSSVIRAAMEIQRRETFREIDDRIVGFIVERKKDDELQVS